jgi:hypothetical protein
MADCFKTYNTSLKKLIDLISNELPQNTMMADIKRRYTAAVTADRTLLLTETGKELFNYRDQIVDKNWDALINREWESEVTEDSGNGVDKQSIQRMIMVLRELWDKYDNEEKKEVQKLVRVMLSEYAKYISAR